MDWFSLKLKLEDSTSGFQTTCADLAGGWKKSPEQAAELEMELEPV
jgi:hypothetical protein